MTGRTPNGQSGSHPSAISLSGGEGGPNLEPGEGVMCDNPYVRLQNAQLGYVTWDLTPQLIMARYRVLDSVARQALDNPLQSAILLPASPGSLDVIPLFL